MSHIKTRIIIVFTWKSVHEYIYRQRGAARAKLFSFFFFFNIGKLKSRLLSYLVYGIIFQYTRGISGIYQRIAVKKISIYVICDVSVPRGNSRGWKKFFLEEEGWGNGMDGMTNQLLAHTYKYIVALAKCTYILQGFAHPVWFIFHFFIPPLFISFSCKYKWK